MSAPHKMIIYINFVREGLGKEYFARFGKTSAILCMHVPAFLLLQIDLLRMTFAFSLIFYKA
jgi:hypothetical protein